MSGRKDIGGSSKRNPYTASLYTANPMACLATGMRYHGPPIFLLPATMHCPFCGANDTKVIDSRLVAEGEQVRRRRECLACGERFTTFETAELVLPRLIKTDGSRQPFDEEKNSVPVCSGRWRSAR